MKEYKVGDTIYAKGKIIQVDDTSLPYYVEFGAGVAIWIDSDITTDSYNPVKPVLPKAVGEELDLYKNASCAFPAYLNDTKAKATHQYLYSYLIDNSLQDARTMALINAWYNGYTVKEEKKYNLILGTNTYGDTDALFKSNPCTNATLLLDADTYADDLKQDKFYQFTQKEIDKYNKDFWIKNIDLNDYKVEVNTDD